MRLRVPADRDSGAQRPGRKTRARRQLDNAQQQYLWRAVDEDGDVLDILVQSRRNRRAATRFFRKLLKRQGREPRRLITDKLRSYSAAHTYREAVRDPQYPAVRKQFARKSRINQPRQRERQMRRFRSAAHLQRFASVHGVVQNLSGSDVTCSGQLTTVS